jgi:hypothetical protein
MVIDGFVDVAIMICMDTVVRMSTFFSGSVEDSNSTEYDAATEHVSSRSITQHQSGIQQHRERIIKYALP